MKLHQWTIGWNKVINWHFYLGIRNIYVHELSCGSYKILMSSHLLSSHLEHANVNNLLIFFYTHFSLVQYFYNVCHLSTRYSKTLLYRIKSLAITAMTFMLHTYNFMFILVGVFDHVSLVHTLRFVLVCILHLVFCVGCRKCRWDTVCVTMSFWDVKLITIFGIMREIFFRGQK